MGQSVVRTHVAVVSHYIDKPQLAEACAETNQLLHARLDDELGGAPAADRLARDNIPAEATERFDSR